MRLSEAQIEVIEKSMEDFFLAKTTITQIAKDANVKSRNAISKHIRKKVEDNASKLEAFERLTGPQRAIERILVKHGDYIKDNIEDLLSGRTTFKNIGRLIGITETDTISKCMRILLKDSPEKQEQLERLAQHGGKSRQERTFALYNQEIRKYITQFIRGELSTTQIAEEINAKSEIEREAKIKRDTILKYINRIIKGYSKTGKAEYTKLSRENKIICIASKAQKIQVGQNIKNIQQICQEIEDTIDYFTTKRNMGQTCRLNEDDVLLILFGNPRIIWTTEGEKDDVFSTLDGNPQVGIDNANHIARTYPKIFTFPLERLVTQLSIAIDFDIMEIFLKVPQAFVYEPRTIYALAMHAQENGIEDKLDIIISEATLSEIDEIKYEDLYERYPLPNKYKRTIQNRDFLSKLKVDKLNLQPIQPILLRDKETEQVKE